MIPGQRARGDTYARILDAAERLMQTRGYASFSYAAVAAELNITKAALHYHFPGKAELGLALITRYAARFRDALAAIDASEVRAAEKLTGYIDLYAGVLSENKMCLCGMLAAEFESLPAPMRAELDRFFEDNERWLEAVLAQAVKENAIRLPGAAAGSAILIVGALEGAMLVTRPCGNPEKFRAAATALLATLNVPAPGARVATPSTG